MAVTPGQVRGMLLEEAILYLLQATGYRTIDDAGTDPTLLRNPTGMWVRGRGTDHQIDAVADFLVQQPFGNPQRLLVEAKCPETSKRVGLTTIRNALGTLRDTNEFWTGDEEPSNTSRSVHKPRYHYTYAVFSATSFTQPAQDFAYAQDIFLYPLADSPHLQSVVDGCRNAAASICGHFSSDMRLSSIRKKVRGRLQDTASQCPCVSDDSIEHRIAEFVSACRDVRQAMLVTLGGRFPVFLVPARGVAISDLPPRLEVYVRWDSRGWYIDGAEQAWLNRRLFSFDLPEAVFDRYARGGRLSSLGALDAKEQLMSSFQAVRRVDKRLEIIQFVLPQGWIDQVRAGLSSRRRRG